MFHSWLSLFSPPAKDYLLYTRYIHKSARLAEPAIAMTQNVSDVVAVAGTGQREPCAHGRKMATTKSRGAEQMRVYAQTHVCYTLQVCLF